jgi:membrane protein
MEMNLKTGWDLIKSTAAHWKKDKAQRLGAALAYYAILALPPLLIILLFIVSLFYDQRSAGAQVSHQLGTVVGPQQTGLLQSLMANPQIHGKGPLASGIAIFALILSAGGLFLELQSALNDIWGVEQRPDIGWRGLLVNRLLSFLLVLIIGLLLLGSVVASTALAAVQKSLANSIPGGGVLRPALEFLVSFGIITLLFALVYKLLPDVKASWSDVWIGAAVTALLFTIGKFALGFYLAHSSVASAYGVAGSLILILIWIYYSAQIFFFGAEFTQVYANRFGKKILPARNAVWKAESESAAEDQEEVQEATGSRPRTVSGPETGRPENRRPVRARRPSSKPPTAAQPGLQAVHELANRINSWHALRHTKV